MDKSQQVGFNTMAHMVPPAQQNAQAREVLPMVTQVMPIHEQTQRAEEFRSFIISLYTQQQSYMNCILNIVTENGCNNFTFSEALTNYITYCASFKLNYPNDYGRNAELHLLLVKTAIYRCVDVKSQFKYWLAEGSQQQDLMQWINTENSTIRNSQFIVQITAATKAAVDKRQQGTGMGFGGGFGGQTQSQQNQFSSQPQQQQNNMIQPQQNNGMMMGGAQQPNQMMGNAQPQNQMMGNTQQPNQMQGNAPSSNQFKQQTIPMMGNVPTPNATMGNAQEPVMVPTPAPVQQKKPALATIRRDGHRLFCSTSDPQFSNLLDGQMESIGGWAINPEPSLFSESDLTKFKKFKWIARNGNVTETSKFAPCSIGSYSVLIDDLDKLDMSEMDDLYLNEAELDPEDPASNGYWEYVALLAKQGERRREQLFQAQFGVYTNPMGDVLTIETKPWATPTSIQSAAMTILGEGVLELVEESTYVTVINNREYILLDSSDDFVNGIIKTKRGTYKNPWTTVDNIGKQGHYYLINHYIDNAEGTPVIEDFYDGEVFMNPADYALLDRKPVFTQDNIEGEDDINVDIPARLRFRDTEMEVVGNTPVQLAEAMRTDLAAKRVGEWHSAILTGVTKQPNYLLTISKKDRSVFAGLQQAITDGTVATLLHLGDWLVEQKQLKSLTLRMERVLDARITKELNVVFNDLLSFTGVLIEKSFLEEYEELISLLKDEGTPMFIEALFKKSELLIIQRALLTEDLTVAKNKDLVELYKLTTPYEFTTDNKVDKFTIGEGDMLSVHDTLHAIVDTTKVYALPLTMMDLGINPHDDTLSTPWSCLPEAFIVELKKNFVAGYGPRKVVIVTKDNYSLTVSGTADEHLLGTLAISV